MLCVMTGEYTLAKHIADLVMSDRYPVGYESQAELSAFGKCSKIACWNAASRSLAFNAPVDHPWRRIEYFY